MLNLIESHWKYWYHWLNQLRTAYVQWICINILLNTYRTWCTYKYYVTDLAFLIFILCLLVQRKLFFEISENTSQLQISTALIFKLKISFSFWYLGTPAEIRTATGSASCWVDWNISLWFSRWTSDGSCEIYYTESGQCRRNRPSRGVRIIAKSIITPNCFGKIWRGAFEIGYWICSSATYPGNILFSHNLRLFLKIYFRDSQLKNMTSRVTRFFHK